VAGERELRLLAPFCDVHKDTESARQIVPVLWELKMAVSWHNPGELLC
jgi:hypothetical protein